MATMGRQITRSVVCHLRQPRWNRLLLKSNMNLHLLSIYQQRRFSNKSEDKGCEAKNQKKKNCIDYKKNPCIPGDEPKKMPAPKPASSQMRITKKRKFMEAQKCKELAAKDKDDDCPCASFSRATIMRGKCKLRISVSWDKINGYLLCLSQLRPDPVYLNQERTFCKKVAKESCAVAEPSPRPPVPPKSERIARKRKHLLAKRQKEAEAKAPAKSQESCGQNVAEAFDQLKYACMLNSQTKECEQKQFKSLCEDLKISKGNGEAMPTDNLIQCMMTGIKKACALHAQKKVCEHKYAQEIAAEETAKLELDRKEAKLLDCDKPEVETKSLNPAEMKKVLEQAELRRLLQEIKEKCKKKREELEEKCRKKAEVAALKEKCKMAKLRKQYEKAKLKDQCEEARLKKQCREAEIKKLCETAAVKEKCKAFEARRKNTTPDSRKDCQESTDEE